jgi:RNA recognition motif-containing protein
MDRETGRPRGFAFVELTTDDAAAKAIENLNGRDLQGRTITVSEARERTGGGGGGGGGGSGSCLGIRRTCNALLSDSCGSIGSYAGPRITPTIKARCTNSAPNRAAIRSQR